MVQYECICFKLNWTVIIAIFCNILTIERSVVLTASSNEITVKVALKDIVYVKKKYLFKRNILIHGINIFDMICTHSLSNKFLKFRYMLKGTFNVVFFIRFPIHTQGHYLGTSAVELATVKLTMTSLDELLTRHHATVNQ